MPSEPDYKPSIRWRRELPPVLLATGLLADHLTPAAMWTIVPPLVCVAALLALRRWGLAALLVMLSSWVPIPAAAAAVWAFDARGNSQRIYEVDGFLPGVNEHEFERCYDGVWVDVLRPPREGLTAPNWVGARAIRSFAEIHNAMALADARQRGLYGCRREGLKWTRRPGVR